MRYAPIGYNIYIYIYKFETYICIANVCWYPDILSSHSAKCGNGRYSLKRKLFPVFSNSLVLLGCPFVSHTIIHVYVSVSISKYTVVVNLWMFHVPNHFVETEKYNFVLSTFDVATVVAVDIRPTERHGLTYNHYYTGWRHDEASSKGIVTRARFLSLAWSKLRLCSANHRAGYFSNLACDWLSIVWAYPEQETENGPRFSHNIPSQAVRGV